MDLYNGVTGYLHLIDILQEGLDLQGGEYNFYIFCFFCDVVQEIPWV